MATEQAHGAHMIFQAMVQVMTTIRKHTLFHIAGHEFAFEFQCVPGIFGIFGNEIKKIRLPLSQKGQFGQIQGHHANGTGHLACSIGKTAIGLLAEPPSTRFVLRTSWRFCSRAIFGNNPAIDGNSPLNQVEEGIRLFAGPGSLQGKIIHEHRRIKRLTTIISMTQRFAQGPIDHLHFGTIVIIGSQPGHAGDVHVFAHERRNSVKGQRTRCDLFSPAGKTVQGMHKILHIMKYLLIPQTVGTDKRSQKRIHMTKGLCTGPFTLHGPQKSNHLPKGRIKMTGRTKTADPLKSESLRK